MTDNILVALLGGATAFGLLMLELIVVDIRQRIDLAQRTAEDAQREATAADARASDALRLVRPSSFPDVRGDV